MYYFLELEDLQKGLIVSHHHQNKYRLRRHGHAVPNNIGKKNIGNNNNDPGFSCGIAGVTWCGLTEFIIRGGFVLPAYSGWGRRQSNDSQLYRLSPSLIEVW